MTTCEVSGRLESVRRRMRVSRVEAALGVVPIELAPRLRLTAPVNAVAGHSRASVVGALLPVLADSACGLALATAHEDALAGPTVELRVEQVRPPAAGARSLYAEGEVRLVEGGVGLAHAVVTDDTGAVVGYGQGHFALGETAARTPLEPPSDDASGADPGRLLDALTARTGSADDPLHRSVPAAAALTNGHAQLHGGMLLSIVARAQHEAQLGSPSVGAGRARSIAIDYLRPAPTDGSRLDCRTEFVRRGRRFRTLRTEVARADGRLCAVATGTWSVPAVA